MEIITHRGLDPSKPNYFAESSAEAFADQLSRGYGLEFDLRVTKDGKIVIIHDANLKRITGGKDEREIRSIDSGEILDMDFDGSHITTFDNLLTMIHEKQAPGAISAIHLKIGSQGKGDLDLILSYLRNADTSKFYIFDTTIATAKYLKEKMPQLRLAPSVALPYDIKRYNGVVGGTLLSVEEVLANLDLFDGVWLDEWDLTDIDGGTKKLYTRAVFDIFQSKGLWVGLVTPELHATSPGLLGGEEHPDAKPFDSLSLRLREIVSFKPDAICTDYPDYVRGLISQ
jgi:hypothetical protein